MAENETQHDPWLEPLLEELPRAAQPSDLLEERTVKALRKAGVLRRRGLLPGIPRSWVAGAAAAALALFASGLALGQWLGSRNAAQLVSLQQSVDARQATALIQQAGQQYVRALAGLAEQSGDRSSAQATFAREAALTVLYEAANEIVRLAPNDPVAAKILQGFDQVDQDARAREQAREHSRRVIWF